MSEEIEFDVLILAGAEDQRSFKLFYPADSKEDEDSGEEEDVYMELFLDVDLTTQRLELSEKDESYRASVVNAFATNAH